MKTVAILGKFILRPSQVEELGSLCNLELYSTNCDRSIEKVIERSRQAHIVLLPNTLAPITAEVLDASPHLRHVIAASSGIDHVDLEACKQRGVRVRFFPGYCTRILAEKTFAYILLALNRIIPAMDNFRNGGWDFFSFQGREAHGLNIAIIGLGATGRLVKKFSEAFGMRVQWTNSQTPPTQVEAILRAADIVTLHLALNDSTYHFLSADRLALMKEDVIIVNTSRGAVIDEGALYRFLQSRDRAYAVLDVLENEPPSAAHPFRNLKNVAVTPHIGWNSVDSLDRLAQLSVEAIREAIYLIQ